MLVGCIRSRQLSVTDIVFEAKNRKKNCFRGQKPEKNIPTNLLLSVLARWQHAILTTRIKQTTHSLFKAPS